MQSLKLEKTKWNTIKINEKYQTSDSKIYACGDVAGEKSTVAWAIAGGKNVADMICKGKS